MISASTIPHNQPTLGLEEVRAAERVLRSNWVAQGKEVEAFEDELCEQLGLPERHAVALSSGSAALFLALRIMGAEDKAVACPVYACSALANAIKFAGARPLFVDAAANSANSTLEALACADAPIAIAVHMFGQPIDLVGSGGKIVIEDCAQALGASIRGRPVGISGDIGIFSFYATKIMTSGGQGGMLVSRDPGLVAAARDFREFDCRSDRQTRFNFQMTDMQAAIGREQLKKLPWFVRRRAEIFDLYKSGGFDLVDTCAVGEPVRYRTVMRTTDPRFVVDRLADNGISAIIPVQDWELLGTPSDFPHAQLFAQRTVSLPTYPMLQDKDVLRIVDALKYCVDLGGISR